MIDVIPTGLEALTIYAPTRFLDIRDFAAARRVDEEKYTVGLGLKRMAVPAPHEDTVTMAVTAATRMLFNYQIDPASIGMLIVASESPVDFAKSTAAYVHGFLGLPSRCRIFDVKQACYGGTAALKIASDWCAVPAGSPKKALVIATDIARYDIDSPGEATQGAGAVAMLVSENPRILTFAPFEEAVFAEDTMDFWRPAYRNEAVVNGRLSIKTYLKALEHTYAVHKAATRLTAKDFDALLFHSPFPKMAEKAHAKLHLIDDGESSSASLTEAFEHQTAPGITANKAVGNIYTGALYLSLASLLEHPDLVPKKRIGLFSYGSGASAEFFSGRLGTDPTAWRSKTGIASLRSRERISFEAYRHLRALQESLSRNDSFDGAAHESIDAACTLAFMGIKDHRRVYERRSARLNPEAYSTDDMPPHSQGSPPFPEIKDSKPPLSCRY